MREDTPRSISRFTKELTDVFHAMLVKIKSVSIRALRLEEEDRLLICKIASSTRSSNVIPCIFYSLSPLFAFFFSIPFTSIILFRLFFPFSTDSSFSTLCVVVPFPKRSCTQVGPLSRDYLKYRGQNNGISIARNAADVYLQLFIASRCSTQRDHAPGKSNAIVERVKKKTRFCRIKVSIDLSRIEPQSPFLRSIVFSLFSNVRPSPATDFHDSNFIRLDSDLPGFEVVCFD